MANALRKLFGTFQVVKNFSTGAPPVVQTVEIWIDGQAIANKMGPRAARSKDRYSKYLHGAVLVKEVRP